MCLTKGPQSLGSGAGLGICYTKVCRARCWALHTNNFATGKEEVRNLVGREKELAAGTMLVSPPTETCHDAMSQRRVHKR